MPLPRTRGYVSHGSKYEVHAGGAWLTRHDRMKEAMESARHLSELRPHDLLTAAFVISHDEGLGVFRQQAVARYRNGKRVYARRA